MSRTTFDIAPWISAAEQHRGFERGWCAEKDSWLEWTVGRLAGTRQFCQNLCAFHGEAAAKYEELVAHVEKEKFVSNEVIRLADKLDWRIMRHMQHQLYGSGIFKDIQITPSEKQTRPTELE